MSAKGTTSRLALYPRLLRGIFSFFTALIPFPSLRRSLSGDKLTAAGVAAIAQRAERSVAGGIIHLVNPNYTIPVECLPSVMSDRDTEHVVLCLRSLSDYLIRRI